MITRALFLSSIMFLISGCNIILNIIQSHQLPSGSIVINFVTEPEYAMVEDILRICFQIDAFKLWNEGNTGDLLADQIQSTLGITFDGSTVPNDRVELQILLTNVPVYDENNNLLGSYPIAIIACFQVSQISNDRHWVVVDVTTTDGTNYTDMWRFRFPEVLEV